MTPLRCPVIVLAKAPNPGQAKTRLISTLGPDGAAALAERMLHHTVEQAWLSALGPIDLCCAPDIDHPAFAREAERSRVDLSQQVPGDLGDRMHAALERWVAIEGCAMVVGTDAPALNAATLRHAAMQLHDNDAVLVPALDGGYALIGLRRSAPQLFREMPWSTSQVMNLTRQRLVASGMQFAELPAVADIDEPADLVHLPVGWSSWKARGVSLADPA